MRQNKRVSADKKNCLSSKNFVYLSFELQKVSIDIVPLNRIFLFILQIVNTIYDTCFKGNAAVDYATEVEPVVGGSVVSDDIQTQQSQHEPTISEKSKKKEKSDWREKYYNSILETDEKKTDSEVLMTKLKSYNLLLKNIELENRMGKLLIIFHPIFI